MCGFIGLISKDMGLDKDRLKKAGDILRHRGPNNTGFFNDKDLFLVHNRLSIIDLDPEANQPMVNPQTGDVIIFNGEIYNYKKLKEEYKSLNWKTRSDSEVVLKLYALLGKKFVKKLNGIFSFVIYDKKHNKLLLYRDRFGVKPLYYSKDKDSFITASEIKGILFFKEAKPNLSAIYSYLEYGTLSTDKHTFFEDIYSLEAGHFMEYNIEKKYFEIHRYWDISEKDYSLDLNEADVIERTYELLNQSIKLNLVSDVEVGISLSSGTDSKLLLKLVQEFQKRPKAFTYGFEEKAYDEIRRVKEDIDLEDVEYYPIYLKKDNMLKTLREAIYYFETPLGGLGTLSAYNMMKYVRKNNIKVMLSGEGADEVFGGYQYYYYAFFKQIEENPSLLEKEMLCYSSNHGMTYERTKKDYNKYLKLTGSSFVLAPDATGAFITHASPYLKQVAGLKKQKIDGKAFSDKLNETMYMDLVVKKIPKLLHFQDRASMANSIETRVPYLEHNLVAYMYSLPGIYKIKDGNNKYLMKKILEKYYKVTEKRKIKHYVAVPQREWLKDKSIINEILDTLRDGILRDKDLIEYEQFRKDYIAYADSPELGNSFFIWKIINLEYLLRQKWVKQDI